MVTRREQIAVYDRVFRQFFLDEGVEAEPIEGDAPAGHPGPVGAGDPGRLTPTEPAMTTRRSASG